jgi:phosphatidylglycerol:prolipoprotein diacylglycerol transferase
MWQVLFTIPVLGGIKVFGYGVMLVLAFVASIKLAAWRARREGLDPEVVYDLSAWVFVGGLIGARLFYVIQYWGNRIHTIGEVFRIWEGGIVLYGSIIGGTTVFFLYRLARPFPMRPLLDVIAPSLAIGIAIGRVGCFLNGCCYGDRCDWLTWSVAFPRYSPPWLEQFARGLISQEAPWSLPVHPTQLYSAIDGLVLLFLLSAYFPLRRRDGEVMALLMVTYPVTRFLIEYLRNDEGSFWFGLTISQNISVLLLVAGVVFWLWLDWSQPRRERKDDPDGPSGVAAVESSKVRSEGVTSGV